MEKFFIYLGGILVKNARTIFHNRLSYNAVNDLILRFGQSKLMFMSPRIRKFIFTTHITLSVGWFGAVVAYLALAVTGLTSQDTKIINAVYPSMELIGWRVIVPLCLGALSTGIIQALVTPWGLFRHYWILVKLGLTTASTVILLKHMPTVSKMAGLMTEAQSSNADFGVLPKQLVVHAGGGLIVLLVITVISVYKPWGMTRYGRRQRSN